MTDIEKGLFLSLFIRNGYVLDFSTNEFDVFTKASIGVALCEKYEMSKGKSLTAYCEEANEQDVVKLFADLLQHYEACCLDNPGEEKNKNKYKVCKDVILRESSDVKLSTPSIACVNYNYIRDISIRAQKDIENGNYDSAITKARTLLEEVFCFVIEERGEVPKGKGEINKLYNQVRDLYNMHHDKETDRRVDTLLSGLNKIIDSVSNMRNANSDAHGVGQARINIKDYHARLFVNAAMIVADFILSVKNNADKQVEE